MKFSAIALSGLGIALAAHSGAYKHHAGEHATTAPAPAVAAATQSAPTWWHPTSSSGPNNGPEFQWELGHTLNLNRIADMGTGRLNAAGQVSANPGIYDVDGIENSAATVTALHAIGAKAICYIEVGSAGNYYAAADEGIPVSYYAQLNAAGDLGAKMAGYTEYYLNVNAPSTISIVESMIRQQCANKGFDAVEPDIDDSYTDKTGFKISEAQNIAYDQKLAAYTHNLGLAWGQKNGDNDSAFAKALEPTTDFLLTEECSFYKTCGIVTPPYVQAGKLVLDTEYTNDWGNKISA